MATIIVIDTEHAVGKRLYGALAGLRECLAILDELQPLRSETIAVGPTEVTRVLGVMEGQQALSDQWAKLKVGASSPATLVEFRALVGLCAPAPAV